MKKILALLLSFCCIAFLHTETKLTLYVNAGSLNSQISKIQRTFVKEITIEGNLNKNDLFFMRDSMQQLDKMNLTDAKIDSIPTRAIRGLKILILPKGIKYVASNGIRMKKTGYHLADKSKIIFSENFPRQGKAAFYSLDNRNNNRDIPQFIYPPSLKGKKH